MRHGEGEVVLINPFLDYPRRAVTLLGERYGLRTVALYTDGEKLRKNFRSAPEIVGPHVSASYAVDERDLDAVVATLRSRHRVVAAVALGEADVVPMARISDALGIGANDASTLALFRDKGALKDHLRAVPGGPRINLVRQVRSVTDVRDVLGETGLERVVLKPNAGVGNRDVLYVDTATSDEALRRYFVGRTEDVLLEEYIAGEEYFVNGQVDERGVVHVFTVNQYVRQDMNGRMAVSLGDFTVSTGRPEFAIAADYARAVMRATGVRRVPFHLELKIDEDGACLIETAARFCGANIAFRDSDAHGGLDVLGIGLHHAVTDEPYGDYAVDWATYDAQVLGLVSGTSAVDQRIYELRGRAAVEAMPEFVRWDTRPRFGGHVVPTVDFASVPWRATVRCRDEEGYHAVSARLRATLRINPRGGGRLRQLPAYVPPVVNQLYGRFAPGLHLEPLPALART